MINVEIDEIKLCFETEKMVFSPRAIDAGTLAMLSYANLQAEDRVLDLGCGYGVVGIYAGKKIGPERVILSDTSEEAVRCAGTNADINGIPELVIRLSDGFEAIPETDFTLILSNPPYHTDFSVARRFIEGAVKHLVTGGRMLMVTKRLDWYKNKLTTVFGGVKVHEKDGYYIFVAEKRARLPKKQEQKTNTLSKKLQRKYGMNHTEKRRSFHEASGAVHMPT